MRKETHRYKKGDILLKIDTRGVYGEGTTRHHVMMVVGQQGPNPIVTHLHTNSTPRKYRADIEELSLKRVRYLVLLRPQWPTSFAEKLVTNIGLAELSGMFCLSPSRVEKQLQARGEFNPTSSSPVEQKKGVQGLNERFEKHVDQGKGLTSLSPSEPVYQTCHEFIFSIIHFTYNEMELSIPQWLQIAPEDAWADYVFGMSRYFKNEGIEEYETAKIARYLRRVAEQKQATTSAKVLEQKSRQKPASKSKGSFFNPFRLFRKNKGPASTPKAQTSSLASTPAESIKNR